MPGSAWWEGTRLVAGRSLSDGLRSRTVRVTTLILLLVGLAVVFVPRMLSGDEPTYTLATVGEVSASVQAQLNAAGEAADFGVDYLTVADAPAVESAVREGDATVGLAEATMYVRTDAPGAFPVLVAQAVVAEESAAKLLAAGLTPQQITEVSSVAPPTQVEVGPVQDEGRAAVGFIVGIVLYMAIMFSGNSIAMNVGVEKSTRIAEVLLAVLRPSQILVGNVVGIGLQTLAQLMVLAVPILAAITITDGLDLPAVAAGDIVLGVAWFVLGFLMYAFLFAAAAALVDKVTEVGSAIMPVTTVLVLAYLGAVIMVQQDPGSALSVALSMFPLTSPMAMPIRWSSGTVPEWQLVAEHAAGHRRRRAPRVVRVQRVPPRPGDHRSAAEAARSPAGTGLIAMTAPRIGLVLGGGGLTGTAFHAGVVAGLAEFAGWDARAAEVIVGTSAGIHLRRTPASRACPPPTSSPAWPAQPMSAEGERVLGGLGPLRQPHRHERPARRPAAPGLLPSIARRPWRYRPGIAAAALLPEGNLAVDAGVSWIGDLFEDMARTADVDLHRAPRRRCPGRVRP